MTLYHLHCDTVAVIWLKYCRYGVKHYPVNQQRDNCFLSIEHIVFAIGLFHIRK